MQPPAPPLCGLRVLDLSRLLPGPFCTLILGDMGAQVDKLEDPHAGDYLRMFWPLKHGLSGRFAALNRNKRSLCLDLKQPAAIEALLRLLPRYDVLVESFRPGVLERLGLGYEVLSARHPGLVVCSISGYGQDGPYRERAGHDLNYLAIAGVLGLSGASPEQPPHPLPIQLADLGGGGLWAAVGILGGLLAAQRTGRGRHVDVSMCEGSLSFMIPDLGQLDSLQRGEALATDSAQRSGAPSIDAQAGSRAQAPERGRDLLTGGAACYSVYTTSCGRYLSVAALEPKFWLAFNRVIGRAADPSEVLAPPADQDRIRSEVQSILGRRTRDEWEGIFAHADACVEPVLTPEEALRHPLHRARGMFFDLAPPGGAVPPWQQVRTPLGPRGAGEAKPPPLLGQHSAEILAEGGMSADEIAALMLQGAAR